MGPIDILPYIDSGGQWTLPDVALNNLYFDIRDKGAIPLAFCSGGIDDEVDFVQWFKSPRNKVGAAFCDEKIAGLSWVNEFLGRTAKVHYVIHPSFWGKNKSRPILKAFLNYWFSMQHNGEKIFTALMGVTPATNRLAVRMALDCGGVLMGTIPDQFYEVSTDCYVGATYTMITPEGVLNGQ
jgi:hypothetical protein